MPPKGRGNTSTNHQIFRFHVNLQCSLYLDPSTSCVISQVYSCCESLASHIKSHLLASVFSWNNLLRCIMDHICIAMVHRLSSIFICQKRTSPLSRIAQPTDMSPRNMSPKGVSTSLTHRCNDSVIDQTIKWQSIAWVSSGWWRGGSG